jgi:hypothetical protein
MGWGSQMRELHAFCVKSTQNWFLFARFSAKIGVAPLMLMFKKPDADETQPTQFYAGFYVD